MAKLVKVKVFPGSKKEGVFEKSGDSFDVYVKAKPQKGKATREASAALARYFSVSESGIRLIKGARQRNKIYAIMNL